MTGRAGDAGRAGDRLTGAGRPSVLGPRDQPFRRRAGDGQRLPAVGAALARAPPGCSTRPAAPGVRPRAPVRPSARTGPGPRPSRAGSPGRPASPGPSPPGPGAATRSTAYGPTARSTASSARRGGRAAGRARRNRSSLRSAASRRASRSRRSLGERGLAPAQGLQQEQVLAAEVVQDVAAAGAQPLGERGHGERGQALLRDGRHGPSSIRSWVMCPSRRRTAPATRAASALTVRRSRPYPRIRAGVLTGGGAVAHLECRSKS